MGSVLQTALELGLISSITVLALYLSYSMLNICDLSTDGAFSLGAAVGAMVALSGHPFLAIIAAMMAGVISGFVTAFLQTKMGIDSLLSGIVVNTGMYSIIIMVLGNSSLVNMNTTETVFSIAKKKLENTVFGPYAKLIVAFAFTLLVALFLLFFLRTKLGLAIRATGDNPAMVRSSSINTTVITIIGLCVSNSFTGLSGALLAMYNKSCNIDIGTGMVTIALASLLIGRLFFKKRGVVMGVFGSIIGAVLFRLVYSLALRLNMPAFMLKLVSSIIVIVAIAGPYFFNKTKENTQRKLARKAMDKEA